MFDLETNNVLLAVIAGAISYGVKEGVRELASMVTSVKELNIKMGSVLETVKDHEQRLRVVEVKKN